jgi:hypothetical protein
MSDDRAGGTALRERIAALIAEWRKKAAMDADDAASVTGTLCADQLAAVLAAEEKPADTRCTVCRADYPETGQRVGQPWSQWGPGYRVCKRCREAAKDARRAAEAGTPEEPR